MVKSCTAEDLQKYYYTAGIKKISYVSNDQCFYKDEDPLFLQLSFSFIRAMNNPSTILFSGNSCKMVLNRVKEVFIDDTHSIIGTVISVVCYNGAMHLDDITYKFVCT